MHKKWVMASVLVMLLGACGTKKESASAAVIDQAKIDQLLTKNTCSACHNLDTKLVGPSYQDIAARGYSPERIVQLIKKPEPENWPEYTVPMIGLPHLDDKELNEIANWISTL